MLPDDRGAGPAVASQDKGARDPKDVKKIKKKKKKVSDKGAQETRLVAPRSDEDVAVEGSGKVKHKVKAIKPAAAPAPAAGAAEGPVAVDDEGPLPQSFAELGLDVQLCEACE